MNKSQVKMYPNEPAKLGFCHGMINIINEPQIEVIANSLGIETKDERSCPISSGMQSKLIGRYISEEDYHRCDKTLHPEFYPSN